MALSKTIMIKDNFGDDKVIQNAYIRVTIVTGGKRGMQALVDTLKEDKIAVVAQNMVDFQPSLEGKNFIAQAYEHLKTLPQFADAVDC